MAERCALFLYSSTLLVEYYTTKIQKLLPFVPDAVSIPEQYFGMIVLWFMFVSHNNSYKLLEHDLGVLQMPLEVWIQPDCSLWFARRCLAC
jgi:hypothetical protein